ncbi:MULTISPECIES: hypothetical protein [unclassified Cyanobium]|uniref:hypothetical protein n=1 Tax=unclassified Cyanobium TaxID=2627006 RepID=UPI0020CC3988|nr:MULTISPECIES: hypothetical protein [unclassified Cyanobium]MCP9833291.1 hypothetical protein [Cyanobium sp. La Preciosa 7G6]MCP9935846.1 hypothetical protein [Cyanobium sp. Aljojuca 7A6]
MNLHDPGHGLRRVNTSDFLSLIALALFATYGVTVLNTILPLAFLQPAWLVTLISALLDSAPLALLGLGLVHLVAYLEPDDIRVQGRRDAIARWAVGAVIGFLLLLPLQAASAFQGLGLVARSQSSAMQVAIERAKDFQRAIDGASSVADLQQRITTLQGPGLQLTEQSQSLPELKSMLSERLKESIKSSRDVVHSPWNPGLWAILQRTLRVLLLATVYALAFAAGSQRQACDLSLLREAQMHWDLSRARVLRRRRQHLSVRQRRQQLQEREALEALAQRRLHPDALTARPAPIKVAQGPSRALPADMAYFHQLSVEGGEQKQSLELS